MLYGSGDYKMKFALKNSIVRIPVIPGRTPRRSVLLPYLLLSPTYLLPRTVNTVRIYKDRNCFSVCPRCKKVIEYEYQSYCGNCGQYLDWSKLDDAEEEFIGWDGIEEDD